MTQRKQPGVKLNNHDWRSGTKFCFGPLHPVKGERLPCDPRDKDNSAFWFFGSSAKRPNKPLSRCKACERLRRGRDPDLSGLVPIDEVEPLVMFVIERIGRAEACRRLNLSHNFLMRMERRTYTSVLKQTAVRIRVCAKDLQRSGEWRHPLDIRHGTAARGKDERRRKYNRYLIDLGDQDEQLAKMRPVDMTPPDKAWWVQSGSQWVPRWGEEYLGASF